MSSFWTDYGLSRLFNGGLDLDTHDIRALLVMSNTTADTEKDKQTLSGYTTLDEMDASGYARVQLTSEAVTTDTTNHWGVFDAANVTFSSLGNGTRKVAGALLYRHVDGTNANDQPIAFIELVDFHPGGIDFSMIWTAPSAGGIAVIANEGDGPD